MPAESVAVAEQRKAEVEKLNLVIAGKAGTEGRLFGSIGPRELAQAISNAGVAVEKKEIRMPDGPIRTTGIFEVGLHLHVDVDVSLRVTVEAGE